MTRFYYDHEIVEQLLNENQIFTNKDREELKNLPEENLDDFHERFGRQIRNFYSFYNVQNPNTFEYKTEKMIKQPFDLSFEIIVAAWEKLKENKQ